MPTPKPEKGEKRQNFVSRCIAELTKNEKEKFPTREQRAAVCYSLSGEKKDKRGKEEK